MAYSFANGFDSCSVDVADVPRADVEMLTGFTVVGDYTSWFPVSTYDAEYTGLGYVSGIRFSKGLGSISTKALYIARPEVTDAFLDNVNLVLQSTIATSRNISVSAYIDLTQPTSRIPVLSILLENDVDYISVWVSRFGRVLLSNTCPGPEDATDLTLGSGYFTDSGVINYSNGFFISVELNEYEDTALASVSIDGVKVLDEVVVDPTLPTDDGFAAVRFFNMSSAYYDETGFRNRITIDDVFITGSDSYLETFALCDYSVAHLAPTKPLFSQGIPNTFDNTVSALSQELSLHRDAYLDLDAAAGTNKYILSPLDSKFFDIYAVHIMYVSFVESAGKAVIRVDDRDVSVTHTVGVNSEFTLTSLVLEDIGDYEQWSELSGTLITIEST